MAGALVIARVFHAWGLLTSPGGSAGRLIGAGATIVILLAAGLLAVLTLFQIVV